LDPAILPSNRPNHQITLPVCHPSPARHGTARRGTARHGAAWAGCHEGTESHVPAGGGKGGAACIPHVASIRVSTPPSSLCAPTPFRVRPEFRMASNRQAFPHPCCSAGIPLSRSLASSSCVRHHEHAPQPRTPRVGISMPNHGGFPSHIAPWAMISRQIHAPLPPSLHAPHSLSQAWPIPNSLTNLPRSLLRPGLPVCPFTHLPAGTASGGQSRVQHASQAGLCSRCTFRSPDQSHACMRISQAFRNARDSRIYDPWPMAHGRWPGDLPRQSQFPMHSLADFISG
jgi:hypothetical protein